MINAQLKTANDGQDTTTTNETQCWVDKGKISQSLGKRAEQINLQFL
jgi:hypothetical protein